MVWVAVLDGTNDYFALGSDVVASTDCYIEIKFRVESTAGDSFIRLLSDTTTSTVINDRIIVESNGDRVIVNSGGGTSAIWSNVFGSALADGQVITIRVETTGTAAKRLWVDGVNKGTANTSFTSLGRWRYFGVNYSSYSNIAIYYIDFTDNLDSDNSHYWDADSSSHTTGTPVLVDTLNSMNASGVNTATDGSVWVDLGGGSLTLVASSIANVSSTGTHTLLTSPKLIIPSLSNSSTIGTHNTLTEYLLTTTTIPNSSILGVSSILNYSLISASTIVNTTTIGSSVVVSSKLITPNSLVNTSILGNAVITDGNQYITTSSIVNTALFGSQNVYTIAQILAMLGIESTVEFGNAYIIGGAVAAQPFTIPLTTIIFVPKIIQITEQDV